MRDVLEPVLPATGRQKLDQRNPKFVRYLPWQEDRGDSYREDHVSGLKALNRGQE